MRRRLGWVLILLLTLWLGACSGGKQSAVEGKLVDWNGAPVAGVKITASQVQPIKGYEQFETVTKADGTFRLSGLFPSSQYVVKPWSDKWTTETAVKLETAPQGETSVLPAPMKIAQAFSKSSGSLVIDLSTGATRFTVSADGVINDLRTGLEWVVGPDRDTNYTQAEQWVAASNVATGGWRMPTRQEVGTLYLKGVGVAICTPRSSTAVGWSGLNGAIRRRASSTSPPRKRVAGSGEALRIAFGCLECVHVRDSGEPFGFRNDQPGVKHGRRRQDRARRFARLLQHDFLGDNALPRPGVA